MELHNTVPQGFKEWDNTCGYPIPRNCHYAVAVAAPFFITAATTAPRITYQMIL